MVELLRKRQEWLRRHMDYKVWTDPGDFHLTLQFLGGVEDISVYKQMVESVSRYTSFPLRMKGVDYFGNETTPRVVYESTSCPDGLRRLYNHFQDDRESRFSPHITLSKKWRGGELPSDLPKDDVVWMIDRCSLFRIHPGSSPSYEKVTTGFLKKE